MTVSQLLTGREEFFKEGDEVSARFMDSYIADRRAQYVDRDELRRYTKNGFYLFMAVSVVDNILGLI